MAKQQAKTKARRNRPRKPQAEKPLPPPVDPAGPGELVPPQPEKENSLFNLATIFGESKPPGREPSSIASMPSLSANGEPMAADAERLLAGVPEVIGAGEADAPSGPADVPPPQVISSTVIISAETMKPLLLWLTDKLAVWRRIDAYRLNDAGADMLAGPYSQVINGLWDKLAPAFLSQICVSVPGLAEAAALSAVAFWPAIQEEMKRSASRRGAPPQKPAQSAPAKPERGGMIYDGGKTE